MRYKKIVGRDSVPMCRLILVGKVGVGGGEGREGSGRAVFRGGAACVVNRRYQTHDSPGSGSC